MFSESQIDLFVDEPLRKDQSSVFVKQVDAEQARALLRPDPAPPSGDSGPALRLYLRSGAKLAPKDVNGKSDPYCRIQLVDSLLDEVVEEHRSQTIKKTLNPEWFVWVRFSNADSHWDVLRIQVWDWDALSSDDFMGEVEFTREHLQSFGNDMVNGRFLSGDFPLQANLEHVSDFVSGSIALNLMFMEEDTLLAYRARDQPHPPMPSGDAPPVPPGDLGLAGDEHSASDSDPPQAGSSSDESEFDTGSDHDAGAESDFTTGSEDENHDAAGAPLRSQRR